MSHIGQIVKLAVVSRVCIAGMGIIASLVSSPYDSSIGLADNAGDRALDGLTMTVAGPFAQWDGVYFAHIAKHGYEQEQFHAFFPLVPMASSLISNTLLAPLAPVMSSHFRILLAGFLLSNLCFVAAAVLLYHLTRLVIGVSRVAYVSAAIFCITPAGVFMSAMYTESVFSMFTFCGLLCLARQRTDQNALYGWVATASFMLAGFTRSNGLVNCGFILFEAAVHCTYGWLPVHGRGTLHSQKASRSSFVVIVTSIVQCLLICLPFAAFQAYSYFLYCKAPPQDLAWLLPESMDGVLRQPRPWCEHAIPNLYSFVQAEYWNVGFMKFYELKQLPNFVLATPMLITSAAGMASFFPSVAAPTMKVLSQFTRAVFGFKATRLEWPDSQAAYQGFNALPYFLLWGLLTVIATLFMHIHVATRFLASCPALYWFLASMWHNGGWQRKAVAWWCAFYSFFGAALFCTFYPWV